MSKVRVVVDSTCDIPQSTVSELGITVVPVVVNFGTETYTDFQLTRDEFWQKAKEVCHPRSSQPSVGAFVQSFAPLVEAGHEVLCLTVTSKLSGTYNSATTAAQDFEGRVTVADSLSLSYALGAQVLAAHEAAEAGLSVPEIIERMEDVRSRSNLFLLFDTIDYLEKGGRASRVMPAVKRVVGFLNIKAMLSLDDGELKLLGAVRSYQQGLARLRRMIGDLGPLETLAVIHVRRPDVARELGKAISSAIGYPVEDLVVAEIGPGLSCHGGPGVIGVLGVTKS